MTINVDKIKLMTNYGLAGEEISPGILKTVYFARNGVFELKKGSWMGSCLIKASDYVLNASSAIEALEETFELNEVEYKLPIEGFAAIYHFYKHVTHLNGNEAQINFYINEKNIDEIDVDGTPTRIKDIPGIHYWSEKVLSYVPIQDNGSARTTTDDPVYLELRRIMKPFIETHSHNNMSAFKSGTDKANSDIEGLQLVFGKLNNSKDYDFKSWATISGNQFDDVSYEEMSKFIDLPEEIGSVKELKKYKLSSRILKKWLKQCTFSTHIANSYGSHNGYYGGLYLGNDKYPGHDKYPGYYGEGTHGHPDYDKIWDEFDFLGVNNPFISDEKDEIDDLSSHVELSSGLISVQDLIEYEKSKQTKGKSQVNYQKDKDNVETNFFPKYGYKLGTRISIKGRGKK